MDDNEKILLKSVCFIRAGRVVGAALFVIALFTYRSYENRPVLGIWSYPFFILIVIFTTTFILIAIRWWISLRNENRVTGYFKSASDYFDLAVLFWGTAYLLSAIDLNINAGRIGDLNIFGSTTPSAVILEWISMFLLFISGVIIIMKRFSERWKNQILTIMTIVTLFLIAEGFIRFRAVFAPYSQGFPTYTSILWGRYNIKLNKDGFRDINHALEKPQATRRLLVIGDSFAFGWGLNNIGDRFGERLAKRLSENTGESWESINASDYDTHTLDHVGFLKQALPYSPDVIILIYVFNDMDYLSMITPRPDLYSRLNLISVLFRNSYLFQETYFRFRILKSKYSNNDDNKLEPYDDETLMSNHIKDISEFADIARKRQARVWVVPFDISIVSDSKRLSRYRNFIGHLRAANIPFISLEKEFEKFEFSQLTINKYDSHPNKLANSIAAEKATKLILEDAN